MFSRCTVFGTGTACADWVLRFLSSPRFSRSTALSYRAALKVFLAWCDDAGVVYPDELCVSRFREWLLGRYRLTTAQSYFAVVRLFFAWLAKSGLYENVALDIKGIAVNRSVPLRDYLSGKEMLKVLDHLKGMAEKSGALAARRNYVMVLLMVCCGLRVTEVTRLDVGDIIYTSGGYQIRVHGKGRDGKSDCVNVPDSVIDEIQRWLAVRGDFTQTSPLFISLGTRNYGGRLCSRTVSQIAKGALVDAGFDSPRLTAHSLRHTAVTLALMGGASLQEAQQYARHSRMETTQIYAHNLDAQQNRCSRLVAQMVMRAVTSQRRNPHLNSRKQRPRGMSCGNRRL